jgi:hypothetical protein
LGSCQREAGELAGAADSLNKSLALVLGRQDELRTDEGKVTFLNSVQDIFDQLISVQIDRARKGEVSYETALAGAEDARSRALISLMDGRERSRATRPDKSCGGNAPGSSFHPAAQMAPAVPSLPIHEDETPVDEEPDEEQLAEAAHRPIPKTILPRIVFHVLPERVAVFAVTKKGEVFGHTAQMNRETLAERVAQLRNALRVDEQARGILESRNAVLAPKSAPEPGDYKPLLKSLYEELIAPVVALMTSFYREYLGTGDKTRALQTAMKQLRSSAPELEHPRYWAPFIVIGAEA